MTRQSAGRTFLAAAGVLGVLGVGLVGAVVLAFSRKVVESGSGPAQRINVAELVAQNPPPADEALPVENPLDEDAGSAAAAAQLPGRPRPLVNVPPGAPGALVPALEPGPLAQPSAPPPSTLSGMPSRPTPVPLNVFTPKVNPQFTELLEQGKLLRGNGDTAGALTKFREAEGLSPGNPLAIGELAFTYEKMSLTDKAAVEWRRILQMGERAGPLYSAARAKLDAAMSAAKGGGAETPPAGDAGEIPQGRMLALGRVTMQEVKDPGSAMKFTLQVPIRARVGSILNPRTEVVTQVLFYDRVQGKDIVRTTANVSYRFANPPADWQEGDTETLEVDYDLPMPDNGDPRGENRGFYGTIVRLYHKGTLQDSHAEPGALHQKFPPPQTLSQ